MRKQTFGKMLDDENIHFFYKEKNLLCSSILYSTNADEFFYLIAAATLKRCGFFPIYHFASHIKDEKGQGSDGLVLNNLTFTRKHMDMHE